MRLGLLGQASRQPLKFAQRDVQRKQEILREGPVISKLISGVISS